MNRVRNSSWWGAVLVGGLLLALPAAAQGKGKAKKENEPEMCRAACSQKANSAVASCALACPKPDESNGEAAAKCMARCGDKFRAATESCDKTCPAIKKPEQLH
ncbi:hypothetical protein JQX13_37200 [Archangium violaceum]|uniref:hypothetical protein n=1 Tax=Archangium violaceum TaxID=83451 RepID=UPI00193C3B26|nr:hypothetical protein [Archangium violaceum]QRK05745.1 hypothetical protein JQX13_37200 [Archangium violaceum]